MVLPKSIEKWGYNVALTT